MPHRPTVVLGTGSYAPARVMTNDDLSRIVETSDEWIQSRSGIRERRIAADDELSSDLAVRAAQSALENAGLTAADIDLLIIATVTPDLPMPATACIVQHKLGIPTHAACFDLNAACSGFLYALDTASAMISSGRRQKALVIGVEKLSSVVDWKDRTTCVLFGDGAGAVVLGAGDDPTRGVLGVNLGADGSNTDLLYIPRAVPATPANAASPEQPTSCIRMKGKEVFKIAVRAMDESARDILEQHKVTADQISLVIPHQANLRIIAAISEYLELPMDRFFVNVDRYGNTSAASIPLALDEARRAGRIQPGQLILLVAFGAGLTYGSALIRW
ncbi:beta-ketoacyl-ACP synthase III [Opitutus sp. ER46]|uniref:beta-ketoacyl-ACP synthase III n=1 Tax=Opitutus sp. ER46 TaxID=2161864 RepID=UPI000D302A3F|nr:beta-ketoacyl-ACP synthase III [Opitutus sp. ER46]PTX91163.1 3-oxoacyl-ACP synthase [Opitutus sp. ER46]